MTKEEALVNMKEIAKFNDDDPETSHAKADDILCDLLDTLGYEEVTAIFRSLTKWYA